MHPVKYVWAVRAIAYKPFFEHIGKMTYMGKPTFIEGCRNITIGDKVRIFPGVRLEAIGKGRIEIGSNVAIEQNVHIIAAKEKLKIGENTTISANVYIANNEHEYRNVTTSVMDQEDLIKTTRIGEGCFIGYGAALLAGTKLGRHCIVGSNAVVRGEFPDYCVIVGIPARIVKRYNSKSGLWENVNEKSR